MLSRPPRADLRPFIETIWTCDDNLTDRRQDFQRERVLPTGAAHVALRLSEHPFRLFKDAGDLDGQIVGHSVIGGPRSACYIRDISQPARSIGAQLRPGAIELLLGVPAAELAGRHTSLDNVWGSKAQRVRDQLSDTRSPERQLEIFEAVLADALPRARGFHSEVARALQRLRITGNIGLIVDESGYSHRRFITLFQRSVGMTPKAYSRVLRFQNALTKLSSHSRSSVQLALEAGYCDQPHFNREFRRIAGISPGRYVRLSPDRKYHVPLTTPDPAMAHGLGFNSVQDTKPARDHCRA
jgi:AraC-like DNA-binding protein